ncbi:MAG TPA: hypothetical protein VFE33_18140 [Thermoanaerobaculia bacterium]|nr:hypothetical protein [Thermoanaerobaculia bacterium]
MIRPILAVQLRSLGNGLRRDPRRRGLLALALTVSLGLSTASAWRLTHLLLAWQETAGLVPRLWAICLGAWVAAGGLGILVLREQAVGDRARLLFTLPLSPAERARALYVAAAAQLGNLWLLSLGSLGTALLVTLGARAWPWIAVALLGQGMGLAGVGVGLALAAALSPLHRRLALFVALAVGAVAVVLLRRASALPGPGAVAVLWGIVLIVVLGPLAGNLGRLYERAFQNLLAASPRSRRRRLLRLVTRGLALWRTPTAALLTRGFQVRGRQWVDWVRLGLVAALLAGFPRFHEVLVARGLPDTLTLPAVIALLSLMILVDGSSSPLGAEGNRLALLLTAPLSHADLLRAKLAALLVPFLVGGVGAALLVGLAAGLPARQLATATVAVVLLVTGLAAVFAWGSAWDADLGLEIEGGLRGLLQEQTPLTPVRALLVAASALLLGLDLLALRALPATPALAALLGLDVLVLGIGWRAGGDGLRRLIAPL